MDFFTSLKVSASGLSAQRARVNAAASNLANVESTRGPDGGVYKRRDPVLEPVAFDDELEGAMGVEVAEVAVDDGPGKRVYMPHHPDADGEGFVTLPNVNPVHEVVNLVTAQRGYDANATAVETTKTMAQRALDIMRG